MIETMEIVFPGGKKVSALYKNYVIHTDKPRELGGEGTAPTSFDLFLASIGLCSGGFVLAFCEERGLSTKGLKLVLNIEKDPVSKMVGKIEIQIQLPPDFPEKYKEAAIKAAEQCTVKKHLLKPPVINVHLQQIV